MSYILDISTAVPEHSVSKEDLVNFYSNALNKDEESLRNKKKLSLLSERTKIDHRYSCIPDFNGSEFELFTDENFSPSVEVRTEIFKNKILPLAANAIEKIFKANNIKPEDVTHLITVSCTGLIAPGFEFLVAEHFGLFHTEKSALNFLGCYAAIKALKQAHYISQTEQNACVLIISAELCSIHFSPSVIDEEMVANLLFADGAAAVIVCGAENKLIKNKLVYKIDAIGSDYIPGTMDLMTWNITSSAFKMFLSKDVVKAIKENIYTSVCKFMKTDLSETDFWAIHPGGVRIIQAVKEGLNLSDNNVENSLTILQQYGNMSSPTILFILKRIMNVIKSSIEKENKKIFSCAFGPGLNIEMISLSSINYSINKNNFYKTTEYAL